MSADQSLDVSRLENVRHRGGKTIFRCPACAEQGADTAGEHGFMDAAGKFGCVVNQGADGAGHRKRMFALAGIREQPAPVAKSQRRGADTLDAAIQSALGWDDKLRGGRVTRRDVYHHADGREAFTEVRFDFTDGRKKEYRPFHRGANGWRMGDPPGKLPLYNLPRLMADPAGTVYVVEGPKCAEAARGIGLLSTTSAHGADSPHKADWSALAGRVVVILPDRDDPGAKYAGTVSPTLAQLEPPAQVRVVLLPDLGEGEDVFDFIAKRTATGASADAIRAEIEHLAQAAPLSAAGTKATPVLQSVTAAELAGMDLPAPIWFVPDLLPQGASLLCGKPKCGKSWLALALGVAVASGGAFLGKYRCARHGVLYLALEDTRRRLKDRMARMMHGAALPGGLHLVTEIPRMPDGLPHLEAFLVAHPEIKLVIVDTLQKFRPPSGWKGVYEGDYDAISPLKSLADGRGLAVLIVHHVRKASADDVFETVSGSHGLTGAVDAMLILKRNRTEREGMLHGTGRDLEDVEMPLRFADDGNWSAVEGVATLPPERAKVLSVLQQAGRALTIAEIAERVGKTYDLTKHLLASMRAADQVTKSGQGYVPPCLSPSLPFPSSHISPSSPSSHSTGEQGNEGNGEYAPTETPAAEVLL